MAVRASYLRQVEGGELEPDPAQLQAVDALQTLYDALTPPPPAKGLWQRIAHRAPPSPPCGLYLYGPVGRGKTHLVDTFYAALPFADKERLHFHHFMGRVHHQLHQLGNTRDPLRTIARDFARRTRVLCFDEFHVSDIGDAMLLGRLLDALIDAGVTLVATSNCAPDALYADGLQRARFLPAIERIKTHCRVLTLEGGRDYRLERLEQAPVYYSPAGRSADAALAAAFERIAGSTADHTPVELIVESRPIVARSCADGVAWFDFAALCNGPRGQADYIELARLFHTLVVSDIPQLDADRDDQARRWIALIDELYERRVNLLCSAANTPSALYTGERLSFDYQRAASRLIEMQSHAYLAQAHRP